MGLYEQKICLFTGLPTKPIIDTVDAIEYIVEINGKGHFIRLPYYANQWQTDDQFFIKNKNLIEALLYNHKWFENEKILITIDELKKLIEKADYPRTLQQKLENLFIELFSLQKEDGQNMIVNSEYYDTTFWKILFFKSVDELNYYVSYLNRIGLIDAKFNNTLSRRGLLDSFSITFEGLQYAIKLQEEGDLSDKCFIAMAFKDETKEIRNAIKSALSKTGFSPIVIDEQNLDSDKTINDSIIANLKKCKFCVADFSFHSNGVYFESGFALGQNKKVIYTCRKDEFEKAHFDVRPLQHIIYETAQQLEIELINKIEAWIK